ncbi:outer membrane protein assembly factor, partial [bacterium]|nr:outer membrane protein assembly factor [bacterium]
AAGDEAEGAWAIEARGATAGGALGGDFDYGSGGGSATIRRRIWLGDEPKLRLDGGFVTGDAPYQSLYFLGGAQRLRGYGVNEFPTRGAVHAALDYKLGKNPLRLLPFLHRLKIQPVPFADAAAIFATQGPDGQRVALDTPEWRFDAGVGLQYNVLGIPGGSGQVRLDFAWRLDRGEDRGTTRFGFTIER